MHVSQLAPHLERLIATVEPRLAIYGEEWWSAPYHPGKWRRCELLGHLVDSASNNHQRFVRAMLQDLYEGPGYDQEGCVRVERFDTAASGTLTALFCSYNRLLAHVIGNVPPEKLGTICRVGSYPDQPLQQLAIDYVAHLEHHLRQLFPGQSLPYSGLPWPRV